MLPSFLISLREGLEAALIIGIVIGALHKVGRKEYIPIVWQGVAGAVVVSLLAAFLLNWLGAEYEGRAEEIFEGVMMLGAALILTWMIFWMQRQADSFKQNLETEVDQAAQAGNGKRALFILAFLAVTREGLELSLFLTATNITSETWQILTGSILGLVISISLGFLIFATTYRFNLARFFKVTNIILILFAAGLVAHGIHELNEAGMVPPLIENVWDINPVLDENSNLGEVLKALFGYNGNPSLTEVLSYTLYFIILWLLFRLNSSSFLFLKVSIPSS
jgi:high-affinity iron transporter